MGISPKCEGPEPPDRRPHPPSGLGSHLELDEIPVELSPTSPTSPTATSDAPLTGPLEDIRRRAEEAVNLVTEGRRGAALEIAVRLRDDILAQKSRDPLVRQELRAIEQSIKALQPVSPRRWTRRHTIRTVGLMLAVLLLAPIIQHQRLSHRFPDETLTGYLHQVRYRDVPLPNALVQPWRPGEALPPRRGKVVVLTPPRIAALSRFLPREGPDLASLNSVFFALPPDVRADTPDEVETAVVCESYRFDDRTALRLVVFAMHPPRWLGDYMSPPFDPAEEVQVARDCILQMPSEETYLTGLSRRLAGRSRSEQATAIEKRVEAAYLDGKMAAHLDTRNEQETVLVLTDSSGPDSSTPTELADQERPRVLEALAAAAPLLSRIGHTQLAVELRVRAALVQRGSLDLTSLRLEPILMDAEAFTVRYQVSEEHWDKGGLQNDTLEARPLTTRLPP